jgi:hypothetical protein
LLWSSLFVVLLFLSIVCLSFCLSVSPGMGDGQNNSGWDPRCVSTLWGRLIDCADNQAFFCDRVCFQIVGDLQIRDRPHAKFVLLLSVY